MIASLGNTIQGEATLTKPTEERLYKNDFNFYITMLDPVSVT